VGRRVGGALMCQKEIWVGSRTKERSIQGGSCKKNENTPGGEKSIYFRGKKNDIRGRGDEVTLVMLKQTIVIHEAKETAGPIHKNLHH